jgi:hypothetical protein
MEFDFRVYGSSGDELGDFLADAYAHANQAWRRRAMRSRPSCSGGWTASRLAKRGGTEVAYHERARITRLRPVIV